MQYYLLQRAPPVVFPPRFDLYSKSKVDSEHDSSDSGLNVKVQSDADRGVSQVSSADEMDQ